MFLRFRFAVGLAVLFTLLFALPVSAKGGFAFITVNGSDLTNPIRLSDRALTTSFFAFADFYQNKTEAPADPGLGYEITRYYVEGKTESPFDQLHYYPDSGFVYYDGIINGSSEYDGKWYIAQSEMKTVFEDALNSQIRLEELGNPDTTSPIVPPIQSSHPIDPAQVNGPTIGPELVLPLAILTGASTMLLLVYWRRRFFVH